MVQVICLGRRLAIGLHQRIQKHCTISKFYILFALFSFTSKFCFLGSVWFALFGTYIGFFSRTDRHTMASAGYWKRHSCIWLVCVVLHHLQNDILSFI